MSEKDINEAVERVLTNKPLRKELEIDRFKALYLRNKATVESKLGVLYQAKMLKIVDGNH